MRARNILVLAEGQLGDLLLLTPALGALKSSFPGSEVAVLVLERRMEGSLDPRHPVVGPLSGGANSALAGNPSVDRLFTLNRGALRSLSLPNRVLAELSIVKFLRHKKFDTVINTFPEDRFALWAFASGAKIRVGQDDQGLRHLLTIRPRIHKREAGVLQYYCALARACGASCVSATTEYRVGADARAWAAKALASLGIDENERPVVVHPGASGDYKIWPPERFAGLLARLQGDRVRSLLLCGPLDREIVEAIGREAGGEVKTLDTGEHLGRLAALLERSSLCISNDSGPRHLAVALGIPTLAFFRLHHDREWQVYRESDTCVVLKSSGACPSCPPQQCLDLVPEAGRFGSHCLRMISLDEAHSAVRRVLSPKTPDRPRG